MKFTVEFHHILLVLSHDLPVSTTWYWFWTFQKFCTITVCVIDTCPFSRSLLRHMPLLGYILYLVLKATSQLAASMPQFSPYVICSCSCGCKQFLQTSEWHRLCLPPCKVLLFCLLGRFTKIKQKPIMLWKEEWLPDNAYTCGTYADNY